MSNTENTVIATDPNTAAVRLGWENLDALTADVAATLPADEDHLVGYVPGIITSRRFAREIANARTMDGGGITPMTPDQVPGRIADQCRRDHTMAATRATGNAWKDDKHRCAITGNVDPTTTRRWIRCIRKHVQVSDLGEAAIITRWAARNVTPEIGALTDDYLDRIGFTTSTEQPTTTRRKRAS